jgi:hypothetical protein
MTTVTYQRLTAYRRMVRELQDQTTNTNKETTTS